MTDEIENPEIDISAELLILEDMGVNGKQLSKINSKAAAEKLIKYYQNKKPELKEETKKPMLTLKSNMGVPLPDPEVLTAEIKLNLQEALDPLSPKRAINNRWNKKARIMMIFDEEHPRGRIF